MTYLGAVLAILVALILWPLLKAWVAVLIGVAAIVAVSLIQRFGG